MNSWPINQSSQDLGMFNSNVFKSAFFERQTLISQLVKQFFFPPANGNEPTSFRAPGVVGIRRTE